MIDAETKWNKQLLKSPMPKYLNGSSLTWIAENTDNSNKNKHQNWLSEMPDWSFENGFLLRFSLLNSLCCLAINECWSRKRNRSWCCLARVEEMGDITQRLSTFQQLSLVLDCRWLVWRGALLINEEHCRINVLFVVILTNTCTLHLHLHIVLGCFIHD